MSIVFVVEGLDRAPEVCTLCCCHCFSEEKKGCEWNLDRSYNELSTMNLVGRFIIFKLSLMQLL